VPEVPPLLLNDVLVVLRFVGGVAQFAAHNGVGSQLRVPITLLLVVTLEGWYIVGAEGEGRVVTDVGWAEVGLRTNLLRIRIVVG
jgi:hypothetical protein